MAKEMDCVWYFPGDVRTISRIFLNNVLSRTAFGDDQRRTEFYYIYANDNLLGGK